MVYIVLPFPESHIVGTILWLEPSMWPFHIGFSLSNIFVNMVNPFKKSLQ